MSFDWGTLTVNKASANTNVSTSIEGSLASVTKYGKFLFIMQNNYGVATLDAPTPLYIVTTIVNPSIISFAPSQISQYGGFVTIVWDSVVGFNITFNPLQFSICGSICSATKDDTTKTTTCPIIFQTPCTTSISQITIKYYMEKVELLEL